MERAAIAGEASVDGMDVWRPPLPAWARVEVQVYDVRYGRFIFHSYEGSIERARRTMAWLRASRHRVRHLEVSSLARRLHAPVESNARRAVAPDPHTLELQRRTADLQSHLRHLWSVEGRPAIAMPRTIAKLESLIGEAEQRMRLARRSCGGQG
jgi:hypothetical protein